MGWGWKTGSGKEARSSLVPGDQDWTGQDGTDGGRGREDVDGQHWVGVSGGARGEGRRRLVEGWSRSEEESQERRSFFQDETSSSIKKHSTAVEHQPRTRRGTSSDIWPAWVKLTVKSSVKCHMYRLPSTHPHLTDGRQVLPLAQAVALLLSSHSACWDRFLQH